MDNTYKYLLLGGSIAVLLVSLFKLFTSYGTTSTFWIGVVVLFSFAIAGLIINMFFLTKKLNKPAFAYVTKK